MVGLMLSLTYAVSRPSNIMKPRCMHNPSAQMPGRGTQHIQQWRKCLCSSFNKTGLIKFLVGEWKLQRYRDMQQGKALYDTYEDTYFKMTTYEWMEVAELQSTQEEEDIRLLLHALHAARTGSKAVIVTAEDTDVMLLCFAFQKDIPCPIYQMCVTQNRMRFVDISQLAWPLGDIICGSLIRLHAVTP